MKYSFTVLQPLSKASVTARIRSSSVTPLLITSRMRWVPASGARVRPDLRTFWASSRDCFTKLSIRMEGRETLILRSAYRSVSAQTNSVKWV